MLVKIRENKSFMQMFPIILLLVLSSIFAVLTKGQFSSKSNVTSMINQCLILGTVSTGAVFVFGSGNVNLAMGGTAALSAVVGGYVYLWTGNMFLVGLACIVAGAIFSYAAVILSKLTKMNILTITTVMMMLYPAIQSWLLGANTITIPYKICAELKNAQVLLILFVAFLLFCLFIFYGTTLGRKIRFLGDSDKVSELTGFNKTSINTAAFLIGGVACGLGAFSTIIRTGNVSVTTMSTGNLNVILSIVIGGMPIFGGYKTQPYAGILGVAVLTVLDSGLLMLGVDSSVLQAFKGIIFMLFVMASWERPQGIAIKE